MRGRRKKFELREYLIVAGLTLLLVWLTTLVWGIARKEEVARHAARETEEELKRLEERKQTLENDLALLRTERGEEATLRETFGVARPGEEVIIVVPEKDPPPPPPPPWWKRMFGWIVFWK
jgi:cell division protein FtsB